MKMAYCEGFCSVTAKKSVELFDVIFRWPLCCVDLLRLLVTKRDCLKGRVGVHRLVIFFDYFCSFET